jgi:two-component system, cell cycle sensor histidine kinase and response regulator CckA
MLKAELAGKFNLVEDYLVRSSCIGTVQLDHDWNILDCNNGFIRMFSPAYKPVGKTLSDYIDLEGCELQSGQEYRLPCSRKSGIEGVTNCYLISTDSGHILFCEKLMLTESRALEQIGSVNNELINLQRELVKNNNLLEKLAQELDGRLVQKTMDAEQLRNRQRLIFDMMPVGACFLKNRIIELANQNCCKIFGYESGEILGMNTSDFYKSDFDYQRFGREGYEAIAKGLTYTTETEMKRKDGSLFWCCLIGRAVNVENIEEGVIVMMQDVSERKKNLQEKFELETQLFQSQKMESVGRLAGGVAHDFNNMLGVILGHADMALMELEPSNPLFADFEEIRKAAERSAELTRQLLAFARKQPVAPKVLNLNDTINGMIKMLDRLIGEDIQLKWLPEEDLWPVKVDPSQLDQILANLCVNARDSIVDKGNITVETSMVSVEKGDFTQYKDFEPGDYVCFSVSDDGCGMDEETRAHIFEPFFTTKAVGEGTGLGLATVYGAVKQNNGYIKVYSEPGKGTVFTIYLPRYLYSMEYDQSSVPNDLNLNGEETILLVEDESSILRMTAKMLEKKGYKVLAADNAEAATALTAAHQGQISLMIVDVVMPDINGRELVIKILSMHPHTKVLYMSGYTADVIAKRGVLEQGVNYIQKPFSVYELAKKVRKVLDN